MIENDMVLLLFIPYLNLCNFADILYVFLCDFHILLNVKVTLF